MSEVIKSPFPVNRGGIFLFIFFNLYQHSDAAAARWPKQHYLKLSVHTALFAAQRTAAGKRRAAEISQQDAHPTVLRARRSGSVQRELQGLLASQVAERAAAHEEHPAGDGRPSPAELSGKICSNSSGILTQQKDVGLCINRNTYL